VKPTAQPYEPRSGSGNGNGVGGGLGLLGVSSADSPFRVFRKKRSQMCLLAFSTACIIIGVTMIASGLSTAYANTEVKIVEEGEVKTIEPLEPYAEVPIGIIVGGSFILLFGLIFSAFYIKVADWRRQCVWLFCNKKQSLARQFQSQGTGNGGGQGIMALNPSTDPLVSHTQYAAVSELPRPEDEERRNLMANDNKDCLSSAEESDRMLEPDPRILLRPMGHVEDA